MAIKVYPSSARIPIKIGEALFKISPFTYQQKIELASMTTMEGGTQISNAAKMTFKAIKFSVKYVEGLVDALTDKPYELKFEDNGCLTDECVNDLLSTEMNDKLQLACVSFMKGFQSEIVSADGEKIEGIEILPVESGIKKNT